MMLSEMYLHSLLQGCEDEYDVRSKLADAGVDYEDLSDADGKMKLLCWNENGTALSIVFDNGNAAVHEADL